MFLKNKKSMIIPVMCIAIVLIGGIRFLAVKNRDNGGATNTYMTKDDVTPIFSFHYPDGWEIEQEKLTCTSEWDILSNQRGVQINYYSSSWSFGSQYYGGNRVLQYAYVSKVADASLVASSYDGEDYSSLGKFVVAKIKVYAYEDGLTDEGKKACDGGTYYAIIPESYLGETTFCGVGYWPLCSFDYVRSTVVLATAPDGVFTSEEEEQVIQILSSFKQIRNR